MGDAGGKSEEGHRDEAVALSRVHREAISDNSISVLLPLSPLELRDEVGLAEHLLAGAPEVHDPLGGILRVRYSHRFDAQHDAHGLADDLDAHGGLGQRLDLVRFGLFDGVQGLCSSKDPKPVRKYAQMGGGVGLP